MECKVMLLLFPFSFFTIEQFGFFCYLCIWIWFYPQNVL